MDRDAQILRNNLYTATRKHFCDRGYLEVETPTLSPHLIPEPTIKAFETQFTNPYSASRPLWLIPSPEVYMKQLLAEGSGSIFQISKCFRNSEQVGSWHNPEFSMLEWYTVDADYQDSIGHTEEFFSSALPPSAPEFLRPPFSVKSMHELCYTYAGLDLDTLQSIKPLAAAAESLGLSISSASPASQDEHKNPDYQENGETWESLFNRIFLTFIEPELPQDRPLIITDYPSRIRCLAAEKAGTPYSERWELYAGGIELANCYTEERNPHKVEAYYQSEFAAVISSAGRDNSALPDISPEFPAMFSAPDKSFPRCSGVALGMDRLLQLVSGSSSIRGVILFPLSDIL